MKIDTNIYLTFAQGNSSGFGSWRWVWYSAVANFNHNSNIDIIEKNTKYFGLPSNIS